MAVSAPTSRSDISKLREEKKRREEEARRKGQEAEAAKAKAGERKPSIGYPEKQQEEQSAPLMPGGRTDNSRRVNSQMDRMVGVAREGREADRRAAENRAKVNSQIGRMAGVVGAESEAYDNAKKTAKAMSPYVAKGLGLLGSLSNLGTMTGATGAIAENVGKAIPDPDRPNPVTRTPGERVDDMGVFADKKDIDRRQEAKEIQAEVDAEDYADAYDRYRQQAEARGDVEILSPEEFVDEMSGTQQSDDGLGRERVGPMVGAHEVYRNVGSFPEMQLRPDGQSRYLPGDAPLNLDGEVFMPNNQGDVDNAGRIRGIIDERKRRNPDEPIPVGLQAQAQAAQRDTYSGVPMTEGSGSLVAPSVNSDGSVGAKTYTRGIPREIEAAAEGLSSQAEKDMYIAQAMGVDLNQYPPEQRQAVAQKFVNEKRGLADRGNMVAAYTDPKTGYFIDDKGNPILDADGKPRKSDVPLAYDEDGNLLPGSEAPVFIRSEEALKRGKQRTNFNNRMQEARNSGNNLIMSFVSRDPETNELKFDEAGFESQYPGSLPPPGPKRTEAISQLTNMIERGRAVQQNRDRLGRRQQESSPTYGPILMRESLQQAETPEEAAMIALYFNRPDIAQFYQQQAMGDRAILAEEQKARAAAEVRAAGRSGDINIEGAGAGSMQYKQRLKSGQLAPGQMANELIASGQVDKKEARRQEATTQLGISVETGVPADAALNAGNVKPIIDEALEAAVPDTGYLDILRSAPGGWPTPLDTFDTIRANFISDIMSQLSIPSGKGFEEALGARFDRRMRATGRKVEERGVGEADAEATMPPAGVGG